MSDQCRHCTMRGDIEGCEEAECSHHGNWYAIEKNKQLDQLRQENKRLLKLIDVIYSKAEKYDIAEATLLPLSAENTELKERVEGLKETNRLLLQDKLVLSHEQALEFEYAEAAKAKLRLIEHHHKIMKAALDNIKF